MALHLQSSLVPTSDSLNVDLGRALTASLSGTTLSEDVEMIDEEEAMAMEVDEKDTLIVDVEMKDCQDILEKKNIRRMEFVFTRCVVNGNEQEGMTVSSVGAHTMRGIEIPGVVVKDSLNRLGVAIEENGDVSGLVKRTRVSVVCVAFESDVQGEFEVIAGTFNDS